MTSFLRKNYPQKSKIIRCPFYEQKMRLSSILSHKTISWLQILTSEWLGIIVSCHLVRFSCQILKREVKMRIFKINFPSVDSIGYQVYPQCKHKFGFLTKKANSMCGNGAHGMGQHQNYLQKITRTSYLRVLNDKTTSKWIRLPSIFPQIISF